MKMGKKIKELREKKGMSQVELAEKVQTSKQTIYKYENDIITNIPSDKVEKIAKALETTPAALMGWDMEELAKQFRQDMIGLESKKNPDAVFQRMTTYDDRLLTPVELTDDELKMIKRYRQTTTDYQKVIYGVVMNAPKNEVSDNADR